MCPLNRCPKLMCCVLLRGLLACANQNRPNSNGSQFFITLDKTDWLDKKHTIFGKVVGDTIYNLLRMGDLPVSIWTQHPDLAAE